MAIDIVGMKGGDPFSSSRIVINDNFKLIKNEVNLIEDYINVTDGIITGVNNIESGSINIGSGKLFIDNSSLLLNNPEVSITAENVLFNANLIKSNINPTSVNNINYTGLEFVAGSPVAYPGYTIYNVSNSDASDLDFFLHAGISGQQIIIVYENNSSGIEGKEISPRWEQMDQGKEYIPAVV